MGAYGNYGDAGRPSSPCSSCGWTCPDWQKDGRGRCHNCQHKENQRRLQEIRDRRGYS